MGSNRQAVCIPLFAFSVHVLILALVFAVPAFAANPTFNLKNVAVAGGAAGLRTADLDQDGIPDLVTLSPPGIAVLFGDGQGNFARVDLTIATPVSLQIADFNGDGKLDIAVATNHQIAIFLNNGNRTFRALPLFTPANWQNNIFGAADFNGDHRADIVLSLAPLDVSVMVGNGDGTFQSPHSVYTAVPPSTSQPFNIQGAFLIGDFNGDGRADIAFAEGPLSDVFGGVNVTTLINQGSLTFTPTHFTEGDFQGASVLDANGDHIDDIGFGWEACHTPCAGADVWTGTAAGSMSRFLIFSTNADLQSLALFPVGADFNGDGVPDVAFSMAFNSGFNFPPVAAHQSVLMFTAPIPSTSTPTPVDYDLGPNAGDVGGSEPMVSADFNLDGKPDIAVVSVADGSIILMLNSTAGGAFPAPPRDFAFSITPATATVAAGQTANLAAAVSRFGAFSDSVTFTCSGLPTGAACSFSPASVTPAVNAPAATGITITTTARTTAGLVRHGKLLALFLPVFGIAFAGIGWTSRRKTAIAGLVLIALLLIALASCGGNASKSASNPAPTTPTGTGTPPPPPAPPANTGTPAGSYTVTVTATSTGAAPITHSQAITLVVQ